MKDNNLRRCLDFNERHYTSDRLNRLDNIVNLLLKELGYEYQENCREFLPKLNKKNK